MMENPPHIALEAAVDTPDAAIEAANAGADRIELAATLMKGGVTPSLGMVKVLKAALQTPVFVLIRPRAGDFAYSELELQAMETDIAAFVEAGADGFVFGVLSSEGNVEESANLRLKKAALGKPCTFHRAFDVCADPFAALESIIGMGFERILTSGQQPSATEGADLIAQCVQKAAGRITILAGGGIQSSNVAALIQQTGVNEVHFSAVRELPGTVRTSGPDLFPGKTIPFPGKVQRIHNAIREMQGQRFIKP